MSKMFAENTPQEVRIAQVYPGRWWIQTWLLVCQVSTRRIRTPETKRTYSKTKT